jgi:hypothetical protein
MACRRNKRRKGTVDEITAGEMDTRHGLQQTHRFNYKKKSSFFFLCETDPKPPSPICVRSLDLRRLTTRKMNLRKRNFCDTVRYI